MENTGNVIMSHLEVVWKKPMKAFFIFVYNIEIIFKGFRNNLI